MTRDITHGRTSTRVRPVLVGLLCLVAVAATTPDDTLYADLGGKPGIDALVEATFVHILSDDRIKSTFDDSDVPRVKRMLADQFCQLSGGPCVYHGHEMGAAHRGLHLKESDFNALVEDLQLGMNDTHVPFRVQNRLLALLAPMEPQVVTR